MRAGRRTQCRDRAALFGFPHSDFDRVPRFRPRCPPMATMHEIDYKIFGDDMQYVEVELDPMEAAVAEAGGMMYMEEGIEMETIFGDGSQQSSGFLGSLMGPANGCGWAHRCS